VQQQRDLFADANYKRICGQGNVNQRKTEEEEWKTYIEEHRRNINKSTEES
jgi:hypothetical protein